MKASLIIEKSAKLLGFSGAEDGRIQDVALNALNRIYADLFFSTGKTDFQMITDFSGEVLLDERLVFDVMPYGVASLIASALGDSENQAFFAEFYNEKRKKSSFSTVQDVLPTV